MKDEIPFIITLMAAFVPFVLGFLSYYLSIPVLLSWLTLLAIIVFTLIVYTTLSDWNEDIKPKDIVSEMEFLHDNKTDIHFWIGEGKQSFAELAKSNAMLTEEVLKMSESMRFIVDWIKRGDYR
jgi:hypothetical protein